MTPEQLNSLIELARPRASLVAITPIALALRRVAQLEAELVTAMKWVRKIERELNEARQSVLREMTKEAMRGWNK